MRNRWVVERERLAGWVAVLPADRPAALVRWQRAALELGEDLGVYRMDEVPELGYRRAEHGPLAPFLDRHPEKDDGPGLFGRDHVAASRVAWFDRSGALTEGDVDDLGAVLAAVPTAAPPRHAPPLELRAVPGGAEYGAAVHLGLLTDLWLPWCSARFEEGHEPEDFADNRELAGHHSPRLNAFLAGLRRLTEECGGRWALDRDSTSRDLLFEVDDDGVRLDAPQPLDRLTLVEPTGPDAVGLVEAVRHGAAEVRRNPPPAPYRPVVRVEVMDPDHPLHRAGADAVRQALLGVGACGERPDTAALRGVAQVQVDTVVGRFAFDPAELTGS